MLTKEPENLFDPNAIRVSRLDGLQLGYVPKDLTHRFPHRTTFGHVHSVGQTDEGMWGCQVGAISCITPAHDMP